jgi:hypothetical protein
VTGGGVSYYFSYLLQMREVLQLILLLNSKMVVPIPFKMHSEKESSPGAFRRDSWIYLHVSRARSAHLVAVFRVGR